MKIDVRVRLSISIVLSYASRDVETCDAVDCFGERLEDINSTRLRRPWALAREISTTVGSEQLLSIEMRPRQVIAIQR